MKKLKADVRRATGATKHSVATSDGIMPCEAPAFVEIVEQDGSFYLLRNDAKGVCITDTWHLTVEEAKEQAAFEYGINDDDWIETSDS